MGVFWRRRELDGNLCANLSQRERRWIDVSEGDAFLFAERRRYLAAKPHALVNALRTTRSTLGLNARNLLQTSVADRYNGANENLPRFPGAIASQRAALGQTRNTVSHPHQT